MRILSFIILISFIFSEGIENYSDYEDVIYLKDGSIIYGIIIETKPGAYYKIKSGRNIFVFQVDEIEVIKKEIINKEDISDDVIGKPLKDRNGVIGIGVPASQPAASLVTLSGNFKVSEHSTFSVYLGFPGAYGFTYDYHQNYNDNGFRFSIAIGQYYYDGLYDYNLNLNLDEWLNEGTLTFAYQLRSKKAKRNKKSNFWVLGIGIQRYGNIYYDYYYDEPEYITYFYPTFTWEHRF